MHLIAGALGELKGRESCVAARTHLVTRRSHTRERAQQFPASAPQDLHVRVLVIAVHLGRCATPTGRHYATVAGACTQQCADEESVFPDVSVVDDSGVRAKDAAVSSGLARLSARPKTGEEEKAQASAEQFGSYGCACAWPLHERTGRHNRTS